MDNRRQVRQKKAKSSQSLIQLVTRGRNLSYRFLPIMRLIRNATPIYNIKLKSAPTGVAFGGTSVVAQTITLNAAQVSQFVSRWGTVFREYIITRIVVSVRAVRGIEGNTVLYLDEQNTSAPTASTAADSNSILMTNAVGSETSACELVWSLDNVADAQWALTSNTATNPVYLKLYTDSNYGSSNTTGSLLMVEAMLTFAFRGVI